MAHDGTDGNDELVTAGAGGTSTAGESSREDGSRITNRGFVVSLATEERWIEVCALGEDGGILVTSGVG
jgi:hypothetical protein